MNRSGGKFNYRGEEGGNAKAQRTRREEEEKGVGVFLKIDDV